MFRNPPGITESDYSQNSELPSCQQLHKKTLPKPGWVLNSHLTVSSLLFRLNVSIHGYVCGYMCVGGIFRTHISINSQTNK